MLPIVIVNKTDFYSVSETDLSLWYKVALYFWYLFSTLHVCLTNIRVVYLIYANASLKTSSNIIVCGILICGAAVVTLYAICSSIITVFEKVWLTEFLARVMAFLSMFPVTLQRHLLALGSVEKIFYFIYVYRHEHIFTPNRTIIYMAITCFTAMLSSVTGSVGDVGFSPEFVLFTIFPESFRNGDFTVRFSIAFRIFAEAVIFLITLFSQLTVFIWSFKLSKNDVILKKDGLVWKRMIRNFTALFLVTIVTSVSVLSMFISNNQENSILKRMSVFLYIYGPSFLGPFIILFGNKPILDVFIKRKKGFVTDYNRPKISTITQNECIRTTSAVSSQARNQPEISREVAIDIESIV